VRIVSEANVVQLSRFPHRLPICSFCYGIGSRSRTAAQRQYGRTCPASANSERSERCSTVPFPAPTKRELLSTKSSLFVYPSRRLGISSSHKVRCISSRAAMPPLYLITRQRVSICGLMIYNTPC